MHHEAYSKNKYGEIIAYDSRAEIKTLNEYNAQLAVDEQRLHHETRQHYGYYDEDDEDEQKLQSLQDVV